MEYKEKLKLDMKKANSFLSEQTLNFGNRTVLTSAFLILISLNFLTITGIEVEGISVSINTVVVTFVLAVVNFYYYQQFILSYDADNNSNFVPDGYVQFKNDLISIVTIADAKLDELMEKIAKIKAESSLESTSDKRKEELFNLTKEIGLEIENYSKMTERSAAAIKIDELKAIKFVSIVKKYRILNYNLPQIIYFFGIFTVLLRFGIYTYYAYQFQENPWSYIWQNEMNYYKIIFENKTAP